MSEASLRKYVSNKLLEDLNRSSEKEMAEAARLVGQSNHVSQCLILDEDALEAYWIGFQAGIGRPIDDPALKDVYKNTIKSVFIEKSMPFPEGDDKIYFKRLLNRHKLSFYSNRNKKGTVFYIPNSFNTIKTTTHKANTEFAIQNGLITAAGDYSSSAAGNATNLDHGIGSSGVTSILSTPTIMAKVSEGLTSEQEKKLRTTFNKQLTAVLNEGFNTLTKSQKARIKRDVRKLAVDWKQAVSIDGNIRADLAIFVKNTVKEKNLEQSSLERAEVNAMLQAFERTIQKLDFINIEGSSTLKEKVGKAVVLNIENKIKSKQVSIHYETRLKKAKLKTAAKTSGKSDSKEKQVKLRKRKTGPRVKRPRAVDVNTGISSKPLAMIVEFNKRLPEVLKKNMRAPALVNNTGRFADSVQVQDVHLTPQGFPSFGYTYKKNPYQTFEPGHLQGSDERDPRRLIDKSMREIAVEFALGRFYTRRL